MHAKTRIGVNLLALVAIWSKTWFHFIPICLFLVLILGRLLKIDAKWCEFIHRNSKMGSNLGVSVQQGADFEVKRRKTGSACLNGGLHFPRAARKAGCSCSDCDVECDFGWVMDHQTSEASCRPINPDDIPRCKVSAERLNSMNLGCCIFLCCNYRNI